MMGDLVDLIGADGSSRVIAVGGGTFVPNQFAKAVREQPAPGAGERILHAGTGSDRLALTRREIERANAAEGVSLVVIFHHWVDGLSEELELEVRQHLMVGFLRDVKGYNLHEVLVDGKKSELRWALAGGFRVRSEYADWYANHCDPQPRRLLFGMARDEVAESAGSVVSLVFNYTPPRFGFTTSQRRLLSLAIQHKTDAEIAAALDVSLSAVKKTWAAIFDRVNDDLFAAEDRVRDVTSSSTTRGAQKRHRLLTYLQSHLEELKP